VHASNTGLLRYTSIPTPFFSTFSIQIWKIKRLVKSLEAARGAGTSMISLILYAGSCSTHDDHERYADTYSCPLDHRPPRSQISQAASMLANEYGTASNIKSRVNRLSVLAAITSTQQRLKLYNRVPTNGLVVYCGTVLTVSAYSRAIISCLRPCSLYLSGNAG
jgi:peptide chain release factor subunit 1